jgi:hypothetical protein
MFIIPIKIKAKKNPGQLAGIVNVILKTLKQSLHLLQPLSACLQFLQLLL